MNRVVGEQHHGLLHSRKADAGVPHPVRSDDAVMTGILSLSLLDAIAQRWSTRIFDAQAPISKEALASALEAARKAPSASNTRLWRRSHRTPRSRP